MEEKKEHNRKRNNERKIGKNRTESKTERNSEQKKRKGGRIEIERKERTKREGRRKEENAQMNGPTLFRNGTAAPAAHYVDYTLKRYDGEVAV